jgi:glycosyltransferase involved in cell wall biosynthesis
MSRIEVVVACYNYGRFLRECVESVLQQSHRDLRVIIVDDASTDDTPVISGELARGDPRVEIRRHRVNQGHINVYNQSIQSAAAEYFLLLSADDFLLPGALERAIAILDAHPEIGMVIGAWQRCFADGVRPGPICRAAEKTQIPIDAAVFVEEMSIENVVATATAIVRTEFQKQLGGYRMDLPHAGDLEMWLRFALHSKIAYVKSGQAGYRQHQNNMYLKFDATANLLQCRRSFMLHFNAIRKNLQNGGAVELQIRNRYAKHLRHFARLALRQRDIGNFLRLIALTLRDKLMVRMARLRHSVRKCGRTSPP